MVSILNEAFGESVILSSFKGIEFYYSSQFTTDMFFILLGLA
jgi:hypothetical protein